MLAVVCGARPHDAVLSTAGVARDDTAGAPPCLEAGVRPGQATDGRPKEGAWVCVKRASKSHLRQNNILNSSRRVGGPLLCIVSAWCRGFTMFQRAAARCMLSVVALAPSTRVPVALAAALAPRAAAAAPLPRAVRACSSAAQDAQGGSEEADDGVPVTDSDTAAQFKQIFTESQELEHVSGRGRPHALQEQAPTLRLSHRSATRRHRTPPSTGPTG